MSVRVVALIAQLPHAVLPVGNDGTKSASAPEPAMMSSKADCFESD